MNRDIWPHDTLEVTSLADLEAVKDACTVPAIVFRISGREVVEKKTTKLRYSLETRTGDRIVDGSGDVPKFLEGWKVAFDFREFQ